MQTLTPQQFQEKYGPEALQGFSQQPQQEPGLFSRIGQDLSNTGNQIKDTYNQGISGQQSLPRAATGVVASGFNAIPKVASEVLPQPVRQGIDAIGTGVGKGLQWLAEKTTPQFMTEFVTKHPDAAKMLEEGLGTLSNAGQIAGDILAVDQGVKGVQKGVDLTKRVANTVGEKTKNAYESVLENASKYPKQIADKITMKKIDAKTQTILQESPSSTFDQYVKTGQEAITDPRKLTPLEVAGQKGGEVAKTIKKDLGTIGQQKADLLKSIGNKKAPGIAVKQIDKIKPLLQKKLTDSERSLVNSYIDELKRLGQNPTAQSVDSTIDKLQATLFEKSKGIAIPVTPRVKAFINQSIGELNSELKSTVDKALGSDAYSKINSLYSRKVKIFSTLNKALGEGGTKGGSLMKRFFSPQDAGVKKLFEAIKTDYGVDLGADATLAKFVMDTLGDTRSRSLLNLPPHTAAGIVGKVLEKVEEKLTSPERVIEKARSLTK